MRPLALLGCLWSVAASAGTLQADDYANLQAAIDAAIDGDTIELSASDYEGVLAIKGKNITIEGQGPESRVFASGAGDTVVFIQDKFGVTLRGLTVDGEGLSRCIAGFDSALTLENVVVTGGITADGELIAGAGLRAQGADVEIIGSSFSDNEAEAGMNGGSIGGTASGLSITPPKLTITDSDFSSGSAELGGGIFLTKGYELEVLDSSFSANSAFSGAAIFLESSGAATIGGSLFNDNIAYDKGGAVYFILGQPQVRDSVFSSNSAVISGGSLYSEGADLLLETSSFTSGTAESGGAIAGEMGSRLYPPVTVIDSCSFTENVASENGGAVSFTESDSTEIRRSTFCLNSAEIGGSVYLHTGGALTASNNSFVEDTAATEAGAVFAEKVSLVSMRHNIALSSSLGAFSFFSGDVSFYHNIVAYSSGKSGVSGSNAVLVGDYNAYLDNAAGDSDQSLGANALTGTDPLFIAYSADGNCENDDLSLAEGSVLIDAGDPLEAADLDGTIADLGVRGGPEANLDWDGDGYDYPADCNDLDTTIHPGSLTACDGVDSDCDGVLESDEDSDGDGYVSLSCGGDDCDDTNPAIYAGATAVCDGLDNDCDGSLEVEDDVDGDGQLDAACGGTDCDDSDPTVGESMLEYCDGVDNNCDGSTDEAGAVDGDPYIEDLDSDGFGGLTISAISVGAYNGCVLTADAGIHCWGNDSYGVNEPPQGNYEVISVGDYHGCALTDAGEIHCWSTGVSLDQGQFSPPAGVYEHVGAGRYHSCALDSQGQISCWGIDDGSNFDYGQVTDTPSTSGFLELSVGADHNCAIDSSAELKCWGLDADSSGAPPTGGPFSGVSAGRKDNCVLDDSGEIICWGDSDFSPPAGSHVLVEVGKSIACAQNTDGIAVCFGDSGSAAVSDAPLSVLSNLSVGDSHACGINLAQGLSCWGDDASQFGLLESGLGEADMYCSVPVGDWVSDRTDCIPDDGEAYPGADEYCDLEDNDCDGETDEVGSVDGLTYYVDLDTDGFGDATDSGETYCDVPVDRVSENSDCNDGDSESFPGSVEFCDLADNDCDGEIDEVGSADGDLYYVDSDGDGYGDQTDVGNRYCAPPSDLVATNTDCDDTDAAISPDASVEEVCDGVDNDCDGDIDDADSSWVTATGVNGFADNDLDGYGDSSQPVEACNFGPGVVANDEDCDDSKDSVHPNQAEDCSTSDDDNCDGYFSECGGQDDDGDGYCSYPWGAGTCDDPTALPGDCNDDDSAVYPSAPEDCDGLDNNCNGEIDELQNDLDGDGFSAIGACAGTKDDCNDYLASSYPGAEELCNGIDDDCNGVIDDDPQNVLGLFVDNDGDGYGSAASCNLPQSDIDCDDEDPWVNPGVSDDPVDGIDNNCDGFDDVDPINVDNDLDGYCEGPEQDLCQSQVTVMEGIDCDDADPTRAPGKDELLDGIDNDCDGVVDNDTNPGEFDMDGDGYCANSVTCSAPTDTGEKALIPGDCNDSDPEIHPGADEICNGRDDNCDGLIWGSIDERDLDADGFMACEASPEKPADCDDSNALVFPGQREDCQDAIDNDCDGHTDQMLDLDGDGHYTCFDDCNDFSSASYFGNTEVCDAVDNDCDGLIDEGFDNDLDGFVSCALCSTAFPVPQCDCNDADALIRPRIGENCTDGIDNDCDGKIDLAGDGDFDQVDRCNGDCDDTDPSINPLKPEICDGIDNNCNGEIDETYDRDGDGYVSCFGDCEDDPDLGGENAHVGLDEECDELDNDCNGVVDDPWPDSDLDGYTVCQGDCDFEEGTSSPEDEEICDDSLDNDCDGDVDIADLDCELLDTGEVRLNGFTGDGVRPAWFCGVFSKPPTTPWAVLLLGLVVVGRRRQARGDRTTRFTAGWS